MRTFSSRSRILAGTFACWLALVTIVRAFDLDSLLVKSVGGITAVESIRRAKTITGTGRINLNGQSGSFSFVFSAPVSFYLKLHLGAVTIEQAYNGHTAWQRGLNGSVSELHGYERDEFIQQVYFQSFSFLIDGRLPGGAAYRGIVNRDGHSYHQADFYPSDRDTVAVFFDTMTARPVLMISRTDNIESRTYFSDYRTVRNILFAFNSRSSAVGISLTTEFQLSEIHLDQPVDSSLFLFPASTEHDFRFVSSGSSQVVPFEYHTNHIFVTGRLGEKKRVRFILDSGASANIINRKVADDLGYSVVGSIPARGIAGFTRMNLIQIDSLRIGGVSLYNQIAGVTNLDDLRLWPEDTMIFGGVLGYDFLLRFPILINYADQTITIFDPDSFRLPPGGSVIPFTRISQVPSIEVTLDSVKGRFLVDLGNGLDLLLHDHFVRTSGLDTLLTGLRPATGIVAGLGGTLSGRSATATEVILGRDTLRNIPVMLPESGFGITGSEYVSGNIGNSFLSHFRVLISYAHNRIVLYKVVAEGK